jgi:hypothetical protein
MKLIQLDSAQGRVLRWQMSREQNPEALEHHGQDIALASIKQE